MRSLPHACACPFRFREVFLAIGIVVVLVPFCAQAATIPDRVREAVRTGTPIWVFLRDKGPEAALKRTAGPLVSGRALARIATRGGAIPPDQDIPVSASYRESLVSAGLRLNAESRWLNAVAGKIDPSNLPALSALDIVDSLRPVTRFRRRPAISSPPSLPKPGSKSDAKTFDYGLSESQVRAIEADRLHEIGLDGDSVMIGFLDTGYDLSLPVFSSLNVIATRDFLNGDEDVGDGDGIQMSHGTATLSVCGGLLPGELIGIAPNAGYALAKTEYTNVEDTVEEQYWIAGLEWVDSIGCDILSSSLGYTEWYEYSELDGNTAPATIAADMAAARGLLVVTAAGNEGDDPWHFIIVPADGDSVLTVGGTTPEGARAGFSSFGPSADGRIKPDVMAPGVQVWSANPLNGSFSFKNGTSFSTPLVAGVCALLLQDNPALTPYDMIMRLRSTATQAENPDNEMGYGIVRAAAAAGLDDRFETERVELWPNPTATGFARIVTSSENQDHVNEFRVFTAAGQPVYTGNFVGSRGHWDGLNSGGSQVASGIYLIWVRTDKGDEVVKLAVRRDGL